MVVKERSSLRSVCLISCQENEVLFSLNILPSIKRRRSPLHHTRRRNDDCPPFARHFFTVRLIYLFHIPRHTFQTFSVTNIRIVTAKHFVQQPARHAVQIHRTLSAQSVENHKNFLTSPHAENRNQNRTPPIDTFAHRMQEHLFRVHSIGMHTRAVRPFRNQNVHLRTLFGNRRRQHKPTLDGVQIGSIQYLFPFQFQKYRRATGNMSRIIVSKQNLIVFGAIRFVILDGYRVFIHLCDIALRKIGPGMAHLLQMPRVFKEHFGNRPRRFRRIDRRSQTFFFKKRERAGMIQMRMRQKHRIHLFDFFHILRILQRASQKFYPRVQQIPLPATANLDTTLPHLSCRSVKNNVHNFLSE